MELRRRHIKDAIKNPRRTFTSLRRRREIDKQFSSFFPDKNELSAYRHEIKMSGLITVLTKKRDIFEKTVKGRNYRNEPYNMGAIPLGEGMRVYSIIRKIKAKVCVETGVSAGFSTACILLALSKNGGGRLYSIDLPEIEGEHYPEGTFWEGESNPVIPKGKKPGWAVPDDLKENWILILGKTKEKLPPLLRLLGKIDFFMHDSEHSYDCMWFEFNEAYRVLNKNGVLASDDIDSNSSFYDFVRKNDKNVIRIGRGAGFLIK